MYICACEHRFSIHVLIYDPNMSPVREKLHDEASTLTEMAISGSLAAILDTSRGLLLEVLQLLVRLS